MLPVFMGVMSYGGGQPSGEVVFRSEFVCLLLGGQLSPGIGTGRDRAVVHDWGALAHALRVFNRGAEVLGNEHASVLGCSGLQALI